MGDHGRVADRLPPNLRRSILTIAGQWGNIIYPQRISESSCALNACDARFAVKVAEGAANATVFLEHRVDSVNPSLLLRHSTGDGHFCRPLMVAHEFRLCLHPGGMLRVQSLHLPQEGLGSA